MKILLTFFYAILAAYIAIPQEPAATVYRYNKMNLAQYDPYYSKPNDLFHKFSDDVVEIPLLEPEIMDLASLLDSKPKADPATKEYLEQYNAIVNQSFKYCSGSFNWWYVEPPIAALAVGCGDCKA